MSLPSFSLEGRVALVTGGSRGIGKAIALAFAEAGADVAVCSRDLDGKLGATAEEIQRLGRHSLAVPADVSRQAEVDDLVQRTKAEFGVIDILVNNAGAVARSPVVEHPEEDWDRVVDTNLKSGYMCSRAAGRIMMDRKRGNIINIASIRGLVGAPGRISYSTSKAGVIMLTRVLALEFASYNIRVNAIAPGWIVTEMAGPMYHDPQTRREVDATIPMGRWGSVEEMANVALFLASDVSSYVTGHTLVADGGLVAA